MAELNVRRPPPCEECGGREIIEATRNRLSLFGVVIEVEFTHCAGSGTEHNDLYEGATLVEDMLSGWELFDGKEWRLGIP